jgi:dTDP-4-dehydrorhamnose reductase
MKSSGTVSWHGVAKLIMEQYQVEKQSQQDLLELKMEK